MSGTRRGILVRSRLILPGSVSGIVPRAAIVALSCSAFAFMDAPYATIAVVLGIVGAVFPGSLAPWGAALVIGLAYLAHSPQATDWHAYATLAVVHLMHVFAALSVVVPWRARMEVRVLRKPLLHWLIIQVPAQAVLAGVLVASESLRGVRIFDSPTAASLAVVAGVLLAAITLLLARSSPERSHEETRVRRR